MDVLREILGERRDGVGVALDCGGAMLSVTRGIGRASFSTCCSLSSLCCTVAQTPPRVSQSLTCCPFYPKSSPDLLPVLSQSRLLRELPPHFPAARRLCVG